MIGLTASTVEVMRTKHLTCSGCCFYDQCASDKVCSHYAPLNDEYSDAEINWIIESEREDYRKDFWKYMSEYNDDLFW